MNQTHKCNRDGCEQDATVEVVWELRCKPDTIPARSTPIARLCSEHATINLWNAFYTPDGWKKIVDAFDGMGHRVPQRKYSMLKTQPLGTAKRILPNVKPGQGFTQN